MCGPKLGYMTMANAKMTMSFVRASSCNSLSFSRLPCARRSAGSSSLDQFSCQSDLYQMPNEEPDLNRTGPPPGKQVGQRGRTKGYRSIFYTLYSTRSTATMGHYGRFGISAVERYEWDFRNQNFRLKPDLVTFIGILDPLISGIS